MLKKITEKDMEQHGVVSAPDRLTGNPAEVKAVFDRLVKEIVAKVVNEIIDAHNLLDEDTSRRFEEMGEELKNVSEINADNLGSNNIRLDKAGSDALAQAYGLTSLSPTVWEALGKLSPLGQCVNNLLPLVGHESELVKLSPAHQYTEHWWMRRRAYTGNDYTEGAVQTTTKDSVKTLYFQKSSDSSSSFLVEYSTAAYVTPVGALELRPKVQMLACKMYDESTMTVLADKYYLDPSTGVLYYFPADAKPYVSASGGYSYAFMDKYQIVETSFDISVAERVWQYLSDEDENAYPHGGVSQDGYEYRYLGIPLAKTVNSAKVEYGEYLGTGVFGEGNPNRIDLSFTPELVIIRKRLTSEILSTDSEYMMIALRGEGFAVTTRSHGTTSYFYGAKLTWGEKSLSWSSERSAPVQLNEEGTVYRYIAIGI